MMLYTNVDRNLQNMTAVVVENDGLEEGLKQPLLEDSESKQEGEDGDQDLDESEESAEESREPATSIRAAYRLLTPSVKVRKKKNQTVYEEMS